MLGVEPLPHGGHQAGVRLPVGHGDGQLEPLTAVAHVEDPLYLGVRRGGGLRQGLGDFLGHPVELRAEQVECVEVRPVGTTACRSVSATRSPRLLNSPVCTGTMTVSIPSSRAMAAP
ncbi:hypothetical protein SANTM175S_07028 [Streptomyces antimycoticus]